VVGQPGFGVALETPGTLAADQIAELLRPSEYTAALIQGLRRRADWVRGANTLEIGSGSGVVLSALGALDAASLCGTDIESAAVAAAAVLLHQQGYAGISELHHGDLWSPVAGRRFDLIVANLPHFPMAPTELPGRLPSWSYGGLDGRQLLDRFLAGLDAHLAPGGRAIITHNAFVGLDPSRAILAAQDLSLRIAATTLVHLRAERCHAITPAVLKREKNRTIYRFGPYTFAEMHVVEIGRAAALC
jgi:release factor glutamine methyltransferase